MLWQRKIVLTWGPFHAILTCSRGEYSLFRTKIWKKRLFGESAKNRFKDNPLSSDGLILTSALLQYYHQDTCPILLLETGHQIQAIKTNPICTSCNVQILYCFKIMPDRKRDSNWSEFTEISLGRVNCIHCNYEYNQVNRMKKHYDEKHAKNSKTKRSIHQSN